MVVLGGFKMRIPIISWFFDILIEKWEIKDTYKNEEVDAILGFSIAQLSEREVGSMLKSILDEMIGIYIKQHKKIILSNDFKIGETDLTYLSSTYMKEYDVCSSCIETPYTMGKNWPITNTFGEANFAIFVCRMFRYKKIVVIANHIHMRRAIAALKKAMQIHKYEVEILSKSVGQNNYGKNSSCQKRFLHPYLFFIYEQIAYPYSRIKGWW